MCSRGRGRSAGILSPAAPFLTMERPSRAATDRAPALPYRFAAARGFGQVAIASTVTMAACSMAMIVFKARSTPSTASSSRKPPSIAQ